MNDERPRCQSCGMALGPGFYGTNASGSENKEYCRFCFQKGGFTRPDLTLSGMIQLSVLNMTQDLQMSSDDARKLAESVIPTLKRWHTSKPLES